MTTLDHEVRALRPREMRAHIKSGDFLTLAVSQRVGSWIAAFAGRRGWTPNALSISNAALGVLTAFAVLAIRPSAPVLSGAVGLVGWHLAFAADCADGQLARATRGGSAVGALVDLYCDFVAHAAVAVPLAIVALPAAGETVTRTAVLAGVAVAPLGLFLGGLERAWVPQAAGARTPGLIATLGRVLHDYAVHVTLAAVALCVGPQACLAWLALVGALHLALGARRLLVLTRQMQS